MDNAIVGFEVHDACYKPVINPDMDLRNKQRRKGEI